MTFRRIAGLLVAAGALPGRAAAQEGQQFDEQDIEEDSLRPEQLKALHARFDADRDGRVSLEEMMQFAQAVGRQIAARDTQPILAEIDTSRDGKLSLEEHLADIHNQAEGGDEQELQELQARKRLEAAKHSAADLNGDGVLDSEELPALFYPEIHEGVLAVTVASTLRMKDLDNDGKLSPKEFWEAHDIEGDELSEEENSDFAKLDVNQDGFLNEAELKAWEAGVFHTSEALKRMIDLADKDGDLQLTSEELAGASDEIAISDAQYHLLEWVEHQEL